MPDPKIGTQFIFYLDGLVDSANRPTFKASPTLASGDVKISKDGGALANLNTLPTVSPSGGTALEITVSATEMTVTNGLTIHFKDAAGAEWDEVGITILPTTATVDELVRSTTPANTLDVSAAGNAGIDWANIASPTTTVNLSGTTVKTATDVETDTQDIQSRLPAALVSGRMDSNMQAAANGVITANVVATDAIDADALATNAIAEIVTAIFDLVDGIETGLTPRQALRLIAAACAGKASGLATTTAVYRSAVADDKDRISATVTPDGDRTAIVYDVS